MYSSGIISNWEILNITTSNFGWVERHMEKEDLNEEYIDNMLAIKFEMRRNVSLFQFSFYVMFIGERVSGYAKLSYFPTIRFRCTTRRLVQSERGEGLRRPVFV